jgi:hypothetical protein
MLLRQFASTVAFRAAVKRRFWSWRIALSRLRFRVRRTRYEVRRFWRERLRTRDFLRLSIITVITQTLYAALLVAITIVADWLLIPRLTASWGVPLRAIDSASYVTTTAAVLQTMGVFLGLLFTAVGVVIGGAYGRVATDIRELVIQEKLSNRYLRVVALTGVYALFLGVLNFTALDVSRSGVVVLLGLTTFSVFSFVRFGMRVYQFLHPEFVAFVLNEQIGDSMRQLYGNDPYAHDLSFQTYYRRVIERGVATYEQLHAFVSIEPPNLSASKDLILGEIKLLLIYTALKSKIPVGSAWYPERASYRSILSSDDSWFVRHNLATATMPEPERRRDYFWLERKIAELVASTVTLHVNRGDLRGGADILLSLQSRIHTMAHLLAVDESLLVERIVSSTVVCAVEELSASSAPGSVAGRAERAGDILQLGDFLVFLPMQVLLGFAARVADLSPESLFDVQNWGRWYLKRDFYGADVPRPVLEALEESAAKLEFERGIEGRVVSADWYLREQYAAALLRHAKSSLEALLQRVAEVCAPNVQRLAASKAHALAVHVALRGLEVCNKFSYHLDVIEKWYVKMTSLHIQTAESAPPINASELRARVHAIEAALYEHLTKLSFAVFEEGKPLRERELPDYFGQVYMMLAAKAFDKMREGNDDAAALFRVVFGLSLLSIKRLTEETEDIEPIARFGYLTEPYRHALELAGYAYLYSQLHGVGKLWRVVRRTWEGSLGKELNPQAVRLIFEEKHAGFMRPWDTMRFNWRRTFENDILSDSKRDTRPPLLQILRRYLEAAHGLHFLEARDIFYFVFLRHQAGFEDAELPSELDALQRLADEGTT